MKKRKKGLFWIITFTGLISGATAGAFLSLTHDLPQIQSLENYKPSAITRVYSADQILLDEIFIEKRDPVPISQIPRQLVTALLTTEDRNFYKHSGLAVKGIIRAFIQNVRKGRFAQGASTLTQQLAKTLFLTPRKTYERKLREAILSLQLERRYTKEEILTLYLNQIYFGSGAYGVASAARIYYNKPVQELSLAQCAMLAGLPQSPSRFSPLVNPQLAINRRKIVLDQMLATGSIDKTAYQSALNEKIASPGKKHERTKAPYFMSYIKKELENRVGDTQLYKGGLTVYTTLVSNLQIAAQEAVANGLTTLETRMTENRISKPSPQGALVALNVQTGGIVAMVGGQDATANAFNRAVTAKRQPGSAFKPFIYALAIERGFQPYQKILDAPVVFSSSVQDQDWQPENFSKTYDGEISLRWALAQSKNIPVLRLLDKLGTFAAIEFAQKMGFKSSLKPYLSLALGTSEVNLLELTAAYAVFANRGKYIAPYGITKVVDAEGHTLWQAKPEQHIAMRRSSAAIITNMLEAVIQEGTGRRAKSLPGPLAGKTGTTNQYKDALFIGFSPDIAAGIWVGNDNATTLGPAETGGKAALPIWIDFMQTAENHHRELAFDRPSDVRTIYIHPKTGDMLSPEDREAVQILVKK